MISVSLTTTVCSVSLMTPTVAVAIRDSGSFPKEMFLVLLLMMIVTALEGTEEQVLYVYVDRTIHQKEDVSDVNCWRTTSMSTSVSNTSRQNPQSL